MQEEPRLPGRQKTWHTFNVQTFIIITFIAFVVSTAKTETLIKGVIWTVKTNVCKTLCRTNCKTSIKHYWIFLQSKHVLSTFSLYYLADFQFLGGRAQLKIKVWWNAEENSDKLAIEMLHSNCHFYKCLEKSPCVHNYSVFFFVFLRMWMSVCSFTFPAMMFMRFNKKCWYFSWVGTTNCLMEGFNDLENA